MLADSGNKSSVLGGKDGGGEFSLQKATAVRICEDSCQPADGQSLKSSLDDYYLLFCGHGVMSPGWELGESGESHQPSFPAPILQS